MSAAELPDEGQNDSDDHEQDNSEIDDGPPKRPVAPAMLAYVPDGVREDRQPKKEEEQSRSDAVGPRVEPVPVTTPPPRDRQDHRYQDEWDPHSRPEPGEDRP